MRSGTENAIGFREAAAVLGSDLAPQSRASRVLYRGAAFWLLAGAVFTVPLAFDSFDLSGAISWRKPITFAVSIALLLATIGWVLDRLPPKPRLAGTIAWTFLVSSTIEVGMIAIQTIRGRASHFNVFASDDAVIFSIMGAAVGVMSLCILAVFGWSLVRRPADRLIAVGVLSGFVLLTTALGLGNWIIQLGVEYVETHNSLPDTVIAGEAGVAKYPHAVALHGIQLFIVAALLLRRTDRSSLSKMGSLLALCLSYASVLGLIVAQTIAGQSLAAGNLYTLGIFIGATAVASILGWIVRERLIHPTASSMKAGDRVDMLQS